MDAVEMARFLRVRRESLTPAEAGLPATARRRTPGLRREEVARLADISVDYYTRLEQDRAPQPSPAVMRSITRALRLSLDERDYLFRLAGHTPPVRHDAGQASAVLLTILQRMSDIPVRLMTDLYDSIADNHLARTLFGEPADDTPSTRNVMNRWFVDAAARTPYPPEDHDMESRAIVADLRAAVARRNDPAAAALIERMCSDSGEFRELWQRHDVEITRVRRKRLHHPEVGELLFDCQVLMNEHHTQMLVLCEPVPDTDTAERLALLSVIGSPAAR